MSLILFLLLQLFTDRLTFKKDNISSNLTFKMWRSKCIPSIKKKIHNKPIRLTITLYVTAANLGISEQNKGQRFFAFKYFYCNVFPQACEGNCISPSGARSKTFPAKISFISKETLSHIITGCLSSSLLIVYGERKTQFPNPYSNCLTLPCFIARPSYCFHFRQPWPNCIELLISTNSS